MLGGRPGAVRGRRRVMIQHGTINCPFAVQRSASCALPSLWGFCPLNLPRMTTPDAVEWNFLNNGTHFPFRLHSSWAAYISPGGGFLPRRCLSQLFDLVMVKSRSSLAGALVRVFLWLSVIATRPRTLASLEINRHRSTPRATAKSRTISISNNRGEQGAPAPLR